MILYYYMFYIFTIVQNFMGVKVSEIYKIYDNSIILSY